MNLKDLKNPPAFDRPWPLFVLNGEYDEDKDLIHLKESLEALKRTGFGGVYLHPRPGLITNYLSSRWFELIEALILHCIELELIPALYDENSYPSGGAGGHVCSIQPETRARSIVPVIGEGKDVPENCLSLYRWVNKQPGERILVETADGPWIAFCEAEAFVLPWHGEVPPPNLLNPLTTETFLQTTHEAYRKNLSSTAWQALGAIFTDEPHLIADQHGIEGKGLPITPYVRRRFLEEYSYALEDHLDALFFDQEDSAQLRFDYYDFCHRLMRESWAKPLHRWTQANNIPLTGHYLEHDWPVPYATPGQMELLALMDWPGTDQLLGFPLAGHTFTDIQNHPPSEPGSEPHLLYTLRQASSVANQFDKKRVMNECWGAGSHASDPADWFRIGCFLIVNGVNHLVPHHCMSSIAGTRKHDHPPFFSAQSPWFGKLRPLTDSLSRMSYAMAQGKTENRVLILDAQTSGFVVAEKGHYCKDNAASDSTLHKQGLLAELRNRIESCVEGCAELQIDFDIGDEYLMESSASVKPSGQLKLESQCYELLVWPPGMFNLRGATVELLSEYLKSGGRMIGVRPDSIRINGRDSELLIEWENQYPRQLTWTGDAQLPRTIASLVPPRLTVIGNCRGCHHLRKVAEGRETWLLVNSSPEKRIFSIPNWNHPQATEVSIDSGEVHDLPINADRSLELAMEPFSARIVTQSIAPSGQPGKTDSAATKGGKAKRLQPHSIRATSPQVLVLDFCELRIGGESLGSWETRHANGLLWKRCGLSPEGWSRTVQYQQKVLERAARHPANAHFETAYSFAIADGVDRTDFELAIEHAQRWEIEVNGQTVDTSHSSPWFDPSIQKLRVDQFLRAGANSLRLQRSSFDPRVEIASAYLVGEFSLNPQAQGFMIEAPKALKLGAWTDQGLHFYDREVEYRFKLERPGVLVVKPEDWSGSWLTAEADGERRQVYPGKALELELTTAGEVKLTVTGLPWNLFGPWHCRPQTISKFTNPSCWNASEAAIRPQAGASYELLKLGLLEAPEFYG